MKLKLNCIIIKFNVYHLNLYKKNKKSLKMRIKNFILFLIRVVLQFMYIVI